MAVRANDFAFRDLSQDGWPGVPTQALTHIERLLPSDVIEIEHYRVEFTAIQARVGPEELDQPFGPL
jgi:hypothetical protein